MGLKCGIVGLPNVGKSTLFNCLSSGKAQAANFPFCTIEPNIGMITVPDERLIKLGDIVNPQKLVPTSIEIVDIAGLVKGASKGQGLGNQFLSNIRETDAIIHVIRCFENENVIHVDGSINPMRDKDTIDTELQLKDLESVEKKMQRLERGLKSGDKDAKRGMEVMKLLQQHLEQGKPARTAEIAPEDRKHTEDIFLLTEKPVIYVCNVSESEVKDGNKFTELVKAAAAKENSEVLVIAAAIEAEIAQLESYEERQLFLDELGLDEPGVTKLIHAAYHLLDLLTYFTAGEKEVRAWTVKRGMTAPQAAGVIHSDFERGFIKADVISYDDFLKFGSESSCRDAGKLFIEGREYVVRNGDVMHFKFNV